MRLPNDLFRTSRELAAHHAVFAAELTDLAPRLFVPWPDRGAYSDGWHVFPLLMDCMPSDFAPDMAANRARCPRTMAVLARYPEVVTAGVSRLLPGAHVFPHRDDVQTHVYRCHLPLTVPGTAGLRAGPESIGCTPGSCYVFDHRELHESANLGTAPRDVLLVDFVATAAELQALAAWRGIASQP